MKAVWKNEREYCRAWKRNQPLDREDIILIAIFHVLDLSFLCIMPWLES